MRLIDADEFEVVAFHNKSNEFCEGAKYILEMIDNAPTVDIAREIFTEIEKLISAKTHSYVLCGSQTEKSIDYGRQYTLRELNVEIAELKNKYIGGEKK